MLATARPLRGFPHPTPDEPGFEEAEQLHIDPEECVDCDACVEACPVDAITPEDRVPPEWQHYLEKNAAYYLRAQRRGPRAHLRLAAHRPGAGSGCPHLSPGGGLPTSGGLHQ